MYISLHVKYPLLLSDLKKKNILKFLKRFFFFLKNALISNFMKIRPVEAELFHADGRKAGQT